MERPVDDARWKRCPFVETGLYHGGGTERVVYFHDVMAPIAQRNEVG